MLPCDRVDHVPIVIDILHAGIPAQLLPARQLGPVLNEKPYRGVNEMLRDRSNGESRLLSALHWVHSFDLHPHPTSYLPRWLSRS